MTGDVPQLLHQWVITPPVTPQPIHLPDTLDEQGDPRLVGCGFVVERSMTTPLPAGKKHTWAERWIITQSTATAKRQQHLLQSRLQKAETRLFRLRPKKQESAADFQARGEGVIQHYQVEGLLFVTVKPTVTTKKQYLGPGRPGPNRAYQLVEENSLSLQLKRDEAAIKRQHHLAGWLLYVTNSTALRLPLEQAIAYSRDEWLIERGYHRFKKGSLPALPLFIRLPQRIVGLMLLLMIALQALTLLEFVSHQQLTNRGETVAELVPGNPKMTTSRPSAERIFAPFTQLHLLIEETGTKITGRLIEELTPLQRRLLALLGIPETIYNLRFTCPMPKFHNST